jgi:hypothetical protein
MIAKLSILLAYASAFAVAGPVIVRRAVSERAVTELNKAAFEEAQKRDDTATRALSNVQIKTSDGKCLFVDILSGDFRANLTPIQVADCGSTSGQGWDIITKGKHNDQAGQALIVSTLTQACMNFDDRRAAGNQLLLFSCGGRADGGGQVTNSQLFAFGGNAGTQSLTPKNAAGKCAVNKGKVLDIANCNAGDATQSFTIGGAAAGNAGGNNNAAPPPPPPPAATTAKVVANPAAPAVSDCAPAKTVTVTEVSTVTAAPNQAAPPVAAPAKPATTTTRAAAAPPPPAATTAAPPAGNAGAINGVLNFNPTTPVPVSRAGGTLVPTAAAEAHQFDSGATRAFTKVSIKAPNGQCLFINPQAGDFRQNLIPVQLVNCGGTPNEQFDVITAGKHNNGKDKGALIVSSLVSFIFISRHDMPVY